MILSETGVKNLHKFTIPSGVMTRFDLQKRLPVVVWRKVKLTLLSISKHPTTNRFDLHDVPSQCPQCPVLNFGRQSRSAASISHTERVSACPGFDKHPRFLPSASWPGNQC